MLDGPQQLNERSHAVIGACIEVHRVLGPGLPECAYEEGLAIELARRSIPFERQAARSILYKGRKVADVRLDLIVDQLLIVELKAVEILTKLHEAQVLTYLRATDLRLGLLVNFNVPRLAAGIRRIANHIDPSATSADLRASAFPNPSEHLT